MKRSSTSMVMALTFGCLFVTPSLALSQGKERAHSAVDAFRASTLSDYEVVTQRHEVVGTIEDLVVSSQGHVKYILLSPASGWGSEDRLYVIPWHILTPNRATGAMVLNIDQERLQNAPSFAQDDWPNMASADWDAAIQQHYSQQVVQEGHQRIPHRAQQLLRPTATRAQRPDSEIMIGTSVLFDFGEGQLTREARATLDNLVAQVRNAGFTAIHLTAHAERLGTDEGTFTLTQRRAARVAAYLVEKGIEAHKINSLSLSEDASASAGQTEGRLARGRQVDIVVLRSGMASAYGMERSHRARQAASRQGTAVSTGLSATVLDVDRDSGMVSVTTEYGDSIELRAREALLEQLQEGDSVEVRLRKTETIPQQPRPGQTGNLPEQQSR